MATALALRAALDEGPLPGSQAFAWRHTGEGAARAPLAWYAGREP